MCVHIERILSASLAIYYVMPIIDFPNHMGKITIVILKGKYGVNPGRDFMLI